MNTETLTNAQQVVEAINEMTEALRSTLEEQGDRMAAALVKAMSPVAASVDARQVAAAIRSVPPPPVEPAPWSVISTDREQPTLARITLEDCCSRSVVGSWWRHADYGHLLVADTDFAWADLKDIESVELLSVLPPEHVAVPVPVAADLIRVLDATTYNDEPLISHLIDSLEAALAKGADQ